MHEGSARLAAIVALASFSGLAAYSQSTLFRVPANDSSASVQLMMDQARSVSDVLSASFRADGGIRIVTQNLLLEVGDTVKPIPLLGNPVGAYVAPGTDDGVADTVSPFGETQSLPIPPDFSGMHSIALPPRAQIQRLSSSKDAKVLAAIVHGFAPAPYLLLLFDGIHYTKIAEFTLGQDVPNVLRVSGDGGTVAVGYVDGSVRIWNIATKSELTQVHTMPAVPNPSPMIGASFLDTFCLSPDGSRAFLAQADGRGQIIDRTGAVSPVVMQLPGRAAACVFDLSGKMIAIGAGSAELLERVNGQLVWSKNDAAAPSSYVIFREDGGQLLFVDARGAHVREAESGDAVLYFTAYRSQDQSEWTAWSPTGRFDGSEDGMRHLRYINPGKPSAPLPVDALMRDYFTPGLAGNVLRGTASTAVASTSLASSGQIVGLRLAGTPSGSVNAAISICAASKTGHTSVRLFRNGLLVKRWQNLELPSSTGTVSLTATVSLLPGTNHLLAYSYDDNGIKSADATVDCEGPKAVEPGTLHILAVGINRYDNNSSLHLTDAEADAQLIAEVFAAQRTQINREQEEISSHPNVNYSQQDRAKFARSTGPVDVTVLPSDQASRKNILSKITEIAGRARPQDIVILFFAGHGFSRKGTFYFLTSDIAAFDSNYVFDTAPDAILSAGSISDRDLEVALEPLDAERIAVIFDACDSGQLLLASTDTRRGPIDAHGFAQLAFEKGIDLLAAAPSTKEATEASDIGHGWLTYALGYEGLENGNARLSDVEADIYLDALFRYAAQEVPKHIAQQPALYIRSIPGVERTLVGFGSVTLDPRTRGLLQAVDPISTYSGNVQPHRSLGDLTVQGKDQHPGLITSVSFDGNQFRVTLAENGRFDQTQWGAGEPIRKTQSLNWQRLFLHEQADVVALKGDGRYVGLDPVQGFAYNIGRVASAAAPFAVGSMAQQHGFGIAFAVAGTAFVMAALCWFWIPETKGRPLV